MPTTTVTRGYNDPTGWISGETVTPEKLNLSQTPTVSVAIDDGDITESKIATGAVTGAAGGGKIAASVITGQTTIADALASGDEFLVHDTSASALRRVAFNAMQLQPVGAVLQTVNVRTAARSDLTVVIPQDDTVPQNTEGTEVMSASITPSSAANKILVRVQVQGTASDSLSVAALFRDNGASAITAAHQFGFNGYAYGISFEYMDAPSTTSETVYRVRVGPSPSGTMYLNKFSSGALVFGAGTVISNITLQEIKG